MNALPLVAQIGGGYSIVQWIIIAIVIAAAVGILIVVFRQFGIAIPPFIVQILWICLAAFVGIVGIGFVLRLAGIV